MPPKNRTIIISAPINPKKLATSKGLEISSPTNLRWQPSTLMRDAMSRAQDVDPTYRLKQKFVSQIISQQKSGESPHKRAQPVENIQVVTSAIELKPRIVKPVKKSLISRVAQKIGLRKKLNKSDIGPSILQPLGLVWDNNTKHSEGLQRMMAGANNIAQDTKLDIKFPGLSRIDESMEKYEGEYRSSDADTSSEDEWSSSASEKSTPNEYRTPQAKIPYNSTGYIDVGSAPRFSVVNAGPYLATTERHLTRGVVTQANPRSTMISKTPLPAPVFEREKPKIAPKPKNLFAAPHSVQPTQNNFLPEITGVKIPLTPAPSSISRREMSQTPSTLTRSRIITTGVAVASATSLIQSNQKSRNL